MEQIRARIREKRGVDYTEAQIQELAAVKLEKFLDPRGVRSDLLDQFRRAAPPPARPNYAFGEETLFETHRGPNPLVPPAAAADLEAVLQPEPADSGAAHPVAAEHDQRRAGIGAPSPRSAVLRADPQPRRRNDAAGHRGQEPEDARRVDLQPARVQRAPRARSRASSRTRPARPWRYRRRSRARSLSFHRRKDTSRALKRSLPLLLLQRPRPKAPDSAAVGAEDAVDGEVVRRRRL